MLCTHVRFHSGYPVEPWHYGDEAEQIVHDWIDLRYRLLPYLYAQSKRSAGNGLPLMRPLCLQWPTDRNVRDLDDQYLLGDDLLVAPLLSDANERDVYLPAGAWCDLFTGERTDSRGQWVVWQGNLRTMPLYVRAGATLPLGPRRRHTAESVNGPITLLRFAGDNRQAFASEPGEDVRLESRQSSSTSFEMRAVNRTLPRTWQVAAAGGLIGSNHYDLGPLITHAHDVGVLEAGEEWQHFHG